MTSDSDKSNPITRAFEGADVRVLIDDDGEPRIQDLELARRLGFASPIDIRKLIRRHVDAGNLGGPGVLAAMAKTSEKGGRPGTEFWLDEASALFVTSQSATPNAIAITKEIIAVFIAFRRGQAPAPATHLLLSDSPSEWREMWRMELHDALCDIYGHKKGGRPKRFVGGLQAKLYRLIAGEDCYREMKRRTPSPRHGDNLHQHFSERARERFEEQLSVVLGILRTSHGPADFWVRMEYLYAGRPMQLRIAGAA